MLFSKLSYRYLYQNIQLKIKFTKSYNLNYNIAYTTLNVKTFLYLSENYLKHNWNALKVLSLKIIFVMQKAVVKSFNSVFRYL